MKRYRLITLKPLGFSSNFQGFPSTLQRKEGLPLPQTPSNYAYVEELPYPEEAPEDGFEYVRVLSPTVYGWTTSPVDAPAEAKPSWYTQPAWRIHTVAEITPYGEGTLMDAVTMAVASLSADPVQQAVAKNVFFNGNILERDSALLNGMALSLGLSGSDLDNLFLAADGIDV